MFSRQFTFARHCFRVLFLLIALPLTGSSMLTALAQEEHEDERKPVYVTVRTFQARIKRGAATDLTDQTFRLNTRTQADYEKWVTSLGKAYPGFEIAQIRTDVLRIYPSPNPGRVVFGPRNGRNLQLLVNVAYSPGDGVTPGLNLIPVVEYHFGDDKADKRYPPVTQAFPVPIDVEPGMTWFFTHKNLSYSPESYVSFVRPQAAVRHFGTDEYFFVFALTHETSNPAQPGGDKPVARAFNDKQSAELQANATKKVAPEWPAAIQLPGFDGRVQVRVEIGPDGHVTHASIWSSSLPEANQQAVDAARKWEFPATLFAESQLPVLATLSFDFKAPQPKEQPAPKAATGKTGSSPAARTAPVKKPVTPKKKS
ncbi:MAG: TonB family protein [Blastocatellia bacterium]